MINWTSFVGILYLGWRSQLMSPLDGLLWIFIDNDCLSILFIILFHAIIWKPAWTFNVLNEIGVVLELIVLTQLNIFMPLFYFDWNVINFSFVTLENIAFKIDAFLLMLDHTKENEGLYFLFQYWFLLKFTHFIYKTIWNFVIFVSGNPWMSLCVFRSISHMSWNRCQSLK